MGLVAATLALAPRPVADLLPDPLAAGARAADAYAASPRRSPRLPATIDADPAGAGVTGDRLLEEPFGAMGTVCVVAVTAGLRDEKRRPPCALRGRPRRDRRVRARALTVRPRERPERPERRRRRVGRCRRAPPRGVAPGGPRPYGDRREVRPDDPARARRRRLRPRVRRARPRSAAVSDPRSSCTRRDRGRHGWGPRAARDRRRCRPGRDRQGLRSRSHSGGDAGRPGRRCPERSSISAATSPSAVSRPTAGRGASRSPIRVGRRSILGHARASLRCGRNVGARPPALRPGRIAPPPDRPGDRRARGSGAAGGHGRRARTAQRQKRTPRPSR